MAETVNNTEVSTDKVPIAKVDVKVDKGITKSADASAQPVKSIPRMSIEEYLTLMGDSGPLNRVQKSGFKGFVNTKYATEEEWDDLVKQYKTRTLTSEVV